MEPPRGVGMKICSNVPGHMAKIASRPIYGKKALNNHLLRNQKADDKLGMRHRVLRYNRICSNDDTGLTLTIFMTWPNLFPNASALVKIYAAYSHVFQSLF